MTYSAIKTEIHGRAGLVQIHRPEALNALNATVMEELASALTGFDADDQVGAMVLTGDARAFASGADIKEMAEASAGDMVTADRIGRWDRIRGVKNPAIAAVSGCGFGGGDEFAGLCEMSG